MLFRILFAAAFSLFNVALGEQWNRINLDVNLEPLLQPDDVDDGSYDSIFPFYNQSTDNEVISPMSFSNDGELCARECDGTTRTCYYNFKIEHYSSMGDACGNCICDRAACTNVKDCNNAHCITTDGFQRNMIVVNRRYPGPPIYVCRGDRIIVDVTNLLQGKVSTLHWHGIFQKGSPWMDGVTMVSQCPILPATTFRYDFIASEAGTHFWHDHAGLIKVDGVQGPLIVREPLYEMPFTAPYNHDYPSHIMFLTDWKHFMSDDEFPVMKSFGGNVRIQALLINGKGLFKDEMSSSTSLYYGNYNGCTKSPLATFDVERSKLYRFRIVGAFCMMCPIELQIDQHSMTVIAVDGNPVRPEIFKSIIISSGERFDIVVNANRPIDYYWIRINGVHPCNDTSQLALLRYDGATTRRNCGGTPSPSTKTLNYPNKAVSSRNSKTSSLINALRVPYDIINPPKPTSVYTFEVSSYRYTQNDFIQDHAPLFIRPFRTSLPFRSTINNISSTMSSYPLYAQNSQVVPSQLCSAECVNGTSKTPCHPCVHLIRIPYNEIVDFIIADPGSFTGIVHPFHLHGHKFYVLEEGMMNRDSVESLKRKLQNRQLSNLSNPPIKDTIMVPIGSYAIIRFRANNPGIWLLHCHYIYHNAVGMHVFLQVGEPGDFAAPPADFPKCGNYQPGRFG